MCDECMHFLMPLRSPWCPKALFLFSSRPHEFRGRYELLLRDLQRRTSTSDRRIGQEEHQQLQQALMALHEIAVNINDRKREIEQTLTVLRIQNQLQAHAKLGTLLRPGRFVVKQLPVFLVSSLSKEPDKIKLQMVYLFSDAMLWLSMSVRPTMCTGWCCLFFVISGLSALILFAGLSSTKSRECWTWSLLP